MAHVTCGSDHDDLNFPVAANAIPDKSESDPMLLELNECPPETEGRERQFKKIPIARPYWSKVPAMDTPPPIPPFIATTEENPEEILPMEYFKHFISNELLD
nr:hypothetical protein HmN_000624700 [Hymenolepis microstoma]